VIFVAASGIGVLAFWLLGNTVAYHYLAAYSIALVTPMTVGVLASFCRYGRDRHVWFIVVFAAVGSWALTTIYHWYMFVFDTEIWFGLRIVGARYQQLAVILLLSTVAVTYGLRRWEAWKSGADGRILRDVAVAACVLVLSMGFGSYLGHSSKSIVGRLVGSPQESPSVVTPERIRIAERIEKLTDQEVLLATNELCPVLLEAGQSPELDPQCSSAGSALWWLSALTGRQVLIEGPDFSPSLRWGRPYSDIHVGYHNASVRFGLTPTREHAEALRRLGVTHYVFDRTRSEPRGRFVEQKILAEAGQFVLVAL
jgi:hypothetical protein